MKTVALFLTLFLSLCTSLTAQQLKGKIIDTDGNAIPYSNVILINKTDSVYVIGVVTDQDGDFILTNTTSLPLQHFLLHVRCVGFKNLYLEPQKDMGSIVLQEEMQMLGEVVVRANRPIFQLNNGKMQVRVEHSLLENLGNATQVLSHLPFVNQSSEALSVFGRGTPLIYIDNRKIQNTDELSQLASNEIKNIELLLNPSVEYGGDVKSVIRIVTRRKGEGVSVSLATQGWVKKFFYSSLYGKFNYRFHNWDFFAEVASGNNKREDSLHHLIAFQGNDQVNIEQAFNNKLKSHSFNSSVGFSYSDSPNQEFGMKYYLERTPSNRSEMNGMTQYAEGDMIIQPIEVSLLAKSSRTKHRFNSYYFARIGQENDLKINFDYLHGNNYSKYTAKQALANDVDTETRSKYHLYTGKIELSTPLWNGKLNYGSEISYTKNIQSYDVLQDNIASLSESEDESRQFLWALFVSQTLNLNDFSLEFGGRFESANYKYYHMKQMQTELSKTYCKLLPFFQINYNKNDISMSLSYTNSIRRPSYGQLNNSVVYIDSYTYQSGNAKLKSSYENILNCLFSWKDFAMDISHTWFHNSIMHTTHKKDGQNAILFTVENIPHYREWAIDLTYSPTFGIWRPTFEVGMFKQNLIYDDVSYNHPYYTYSYSNIIRMTRNINFSIDMWGTSRGNLYLDEFKPAFRIDASLNAQFLNKKLSVWLKTTDIFGTDKERWNSTINKIFIAKDKRLDTKGVMLQIRYSFNPQRNKYKGQTTSSEVNRL